MGRISLRPSLGVDRLAVGDVGMGRMAGNHQMQTIRWALPDTNQHRSVRRGAIDRPLAVGCCLTDRSHHHPLVRACDGYPVRPFISDAGTRTE